MRRAWIAVLAVATLAMPGAAFAHGDDGSQSSERNRSKACKALRAQMGADLFRDTYGRNSKRNAHGKCVSGYRQVFKKLVAQARRGVQGPARRLAAAVTSGEAPRTATRTSAFRHCVKEKLRALLAERRAALDAAARPATTRTHDANAFVEKYGTGERKRHAFRACVVQTFRAGEEAKTTP